MTLTVWLSPVSMLLLLLLGLVVMLLRLLLLLLFFLNYLVTTIHLDLMIAAQWRPADVSWTSRGRQLDVSSAFT